MTPFPPSPRGLGWGRECSRVWPSGTNWCDTNFDVFSRTHLSRTHDAAHLKSALSTTEVRWKLIFFHIYQVQNKRHAGLNIIIVENFQFGVSNTHSVTNYCAAYSYILISHPFIKGRMMTYLQRLRYTEECMLWQNWFNAKKAICNGTSAKEFDMS